MIATGTPCCARHAHLVAWHCAAAAPAYRKNVCQGVRRLDTTATDGAYDVDSQAYLVTYNSGSFATQRDYTWTFGMRRNRADTSDVRVGVWIGECDAFVGIPTFALNAAAFEDPFPSSFTPPVASTARTVARWTSSGWEILLRTGSAGFMSATDFTDNDFRPLDAWSSDGFGEPLGPAAALAAFDLTQADLSSGTIEATIETPTRVITAELPFLVASHSGTETLYRFRKTSTYTSGVPAAAVLGPQTETVTLDLTFRSCSTRPYLAVLRIVAPSFYYYGAVPAVVVAPTSCVSIWMPAAGNWLEFGFEGNSFGSQGNIDGLYGLAHPFSWDVDGIFGMDQDFSNSEIPAETRGLNWRTENVAESGICRVTGLRKI